MTFIWFDNTSVYNCCQSITTVKEIFAAHLKMCRNVRLARMFVAVIPDSRRLTVDGYYLVNRMYLLIVFISTHSCFNHDLSYSTNDY